MAWYDEAIFYHIYPLGLTGAPKKNDYGAPVHRLNTLLPWIEHLRRLGFTALYIGPLFQSVGHGYETTDYRVLDTRLGTNDDLTAFVRACHDAGIRVVFDGVFNHTGRDFFAFRNLREHRENSAYRDWYCNVNFWGNNEYNDGFSYDNWGGYNLMAKLNQRNPAVRDYLCDVIRFWVETFDVDGIRLDAADVLDFDFMKALRATADAVKPDFWLMGEVIHGDYSRWANEHTLHSVTDYALHKALFSGHNDHNYFEIAHTVRRTLGMVPAHIRLYNFVDNHDVERIYTKLSTKAHYLPVHVLLYTLPGIPSVYYGSEFGIEGRKERFSDDSLRPCIDLGEHANDYESNPCTVLVEALGAVRHAYADDLVWGAYRELSLTTEQYAFARGRLVVAVNNAEHEATVDVTVAADGTYVGLLHGNKIVAKDGRLHIELAPCGGDIFAPVEDGEAGVEGDDVATDAGSTGAMGEGTGATDGASTRADSEAGTDSEAGADTQVAVEGRSTGRIGSSIRTGAKTEDAGGAKSDGSTETAVQPARPAITIEFPLDTKPATGAGSDGCAATAVLPNVGDVPIPNVPLEEMEIEELQAVILAKLAKNGPVTDQMRRDVASNIWRDSLLNWARSFR